MSMTKEEFKRRLEVLVRVGQMSPSQMEAKLAAFDAQNASQSTTQREPQRNFGRGAPTSRPPARGGGSRVDMSQYASAPYRFVPFDSGSFVAAEPATREDINRPKADGLCAEIDLCWTAETPLLIGTQKKGGSNEPSSIVTPLTLGGANGYFIPGATLRGAIRAIAEMASGARLNQVNANRVFPLRDFNHGVYRPSTSDGRDIDYAVIEGQEYYPVSQVSKVQAGWLRLKADKSGPSLAGNKVQRERLDADWNNAFEIVPCKWSVVTADDLWQSNDLDKRSLSSDRNPPNNGDSFTKCDLKAKYESAGCVDRGVIYPHSKERSFTESGDRYGATRVRPNGGKKGYYVFSGKAPNGKKVEFVFHDEQTTAFPVPDDILCKFRQLNSRAVDDQLEPENTWAEAVKAFASNRNALWPVFYVGTQPQLDIDGRRITSPGDAPFFFGLTRLFKVPHAWSFNRVLANSGISTPLDEQGEKVKLENLDMVDALFGYVYETDVDQDAQQSSNLARKGRIAFSAARLEAGTQARLSSPIDTVMMGPRPSFAPFYLEEDRQGFRDYSSTLVPKIAGRKRYPPRDANNQPDGALSRVKAKLQRQIELIEAATRRPPNNNVKTRLTFLEPRSNAPLRFTSKVRLFNVTEAELGLALWALTFGGNEATHRHMLGRAKGFGAGQMKLDITALKVDYNDARAAPEGDISERRSLFIGKLDAYLGTNGTAFAKIGAMRKALLSTADPAIGMRFDSQGKLDNMPLNRQIEGKNKPMFQGLRDMTKPNPRQPTPIRKTFLPLE